MERLRTDEKMTEIEKIVTKQNAVVALNAISTAVDISIIVSQAMQNLSDSFDRQMRAAESMANGLKAITKTLSIFSREIKFWKFVNNNRVKHKSKRNKWIH